MSLSVKHCCSVVILSLMLAACLPGNSKEEKVIAQAQHATQQVAAERLAADMASSAQVLIAGVIPNTSNSELRTVSCGNGTKVAAFIPRTSKVAHGGKIDTLIANRIQMQLKSQYGADSVGDAQSMAGKCDMLNTDSVALNAPVLLLDNVSANMAQIPQGDNSVSIKTEPCQSIDNKTVPGSIVVKTASDGTVTTENHCGQPLDNHVMPNIVLSTNQMPNWKAQLQGHSDAMPFNIKCIVHQDNGKCEQLSDSDIGNLTQCDAASQSENYVSNPQFDNASHSFITGAASVDCGKGWHGQLIARVRSQQCTITVNGQKQDPATIYDVAYVAAKCSKDDVKNILAQCPAGNGTFYAEYGHADMVNPVILEPQPSVTDPVTGKQVTPSLVALPGYTPDANVVRNVPALTNSSSLFVPSVNLRNFAKGDAGDTAFSAALVNNMKSNAHLTTITGCNIEGNQCPGGPGGIPSHIVFVLDRSSSMGSSDPSDLINVPPTITQAYSCKAGLRNLFASEQADDACSAASQYVHGISFGASDSNSDNPPKVSDFVLRPWATGKGPTNDATTALYTKMQNALTDQAKYTPYLQFALSTGWDCSGRAQAGSNDKETFPDDMFGTCSGAQQNGTCEASCPGQCEESDIGTVPDSLSTQRIQAAQWILQQVTRMNLNKNTKITLASFLNDTSNVQTVTYCPKNRQNSDGTCDMARERDALTNLFVRPTDVKQYLKPLAQQVTIPTGPPPAPTVMIVPDTRQISGPINEDGSTFEAPSGTVITGRQHHGDADNSDIGKQSTRYEYSSLKIIDQNGMPVPGQVFLKDYQWSGQIAEKAGIWFHAPSGRAIVGRRHFYDEKGNTQYETAAVTFIAGGATSEQAVTTISGAQFGPLEESDKKSDCTKRGHVTCNQGAGIFYKTDAKSIMIGRMHNDDENGDTYYQEGTLTAPLNCTTPTATVPSTVWETYDQATANGTTGDDQSKYNFQNCSGLISVDPCQAYGEACARTNDSNSSDCLAEASCRADAARLGTDTPQVPFGGNAWNTGNDNYCVERQLKVAAPVALPAACHVCDPSICLAQAGTSGPGPWETAAQAKAAGDFDDSKIAGKQITDNNQQDNTKYEFRDCPVFSCPTYSYHGQGPQGSQTYNIVDDSGLFSAMSLNTAQCITAYRAAEKNGWIVNGSKTVTETCNGFPCDGTWTFAGQGQYCNQRRLKVAAPVFESFLAAHSDGTFSNPGDADYQDCTAGPHGEFRTSGGGIYLTSADWTNAKNNSLNAVVTQLNNYFAQFDSHIKVSPSSFRLRTTTPPQVGTGIAVMVYDLIFPIKFQSGSASYIPWDQSTVSVPYNSHTSQVNYCASRRLKAADNSEALATCLDGLGCPAKITALTSVTTYQTTKDLFTGLTTVKPVTVSMPSAMDYTQPNYSGATVVKTVTRKIPAQAGDAGATQVTGGSPTYGIDYGGNTPLFSTIDAALNEASIKTDMQAGSTMGFILLTDGMDTGATATTTSPCGDENTSFLNRLSSLDSNAQLLVVSLSGTNATLLDACGSKLDSSKFVSSHSLVQAASKIATFLHVDGGSLTGASGLDAAKTFCVSTYGSSYDDATVTTSSSSPGGAIPPAVCRPFEIQQ